MKRGSTLFLRIALFFIGIPVLSLAVYGGIWLVNNAVDQKYDHILYPILIGLYGSVIPFFNALIQSFKLLNYIDKNQAFSELSVKALKTIKFCAIIIVGLYTAVLPFIYLLADLDDAPGLIIIGMVPIFASLVIAVFAAVLQRLLKEAIDIKSENDLII